MMNSKSNSFLRLIGAAGNEKELIERLVHDLGIKTFLDNADSIVLSQKTKNALEWLNNILYQQGNIPESLSGLTEIPTKTFTQNNIKELELLTIKDHPELLDVDARQETEAINPPISFINETIIETIQKPEELSMEVVNQSLTYNKELIKQKLIRYKKTSNNICIANKIP